MCVAPCASARIPPSRSVSRRASIAVAVAVCLVLAACSTTRAKPVDLTPSLDQPRQVVRLPWRSGVTGAQVDAYLQRIGVQATVVGVVFTDDAISKTLLLYPATNWPSASRAQALAVLENSGLFQGPAPTSTG
jgi:hypothetical protein